MHRFVVRAAAALLALAAGPLAAAPAQALENPVDITSITPQKVVVDSPGCRDILVDTAVTTSLNWQFLTANVHAYHSGLLRGDLIASPGGPSPFHMCISSDDLGRWTFGPSKVHVYDETAATRRDFVDTTTGTMWVKAAAKASVTSTRSGSTVRFTAVTTRYSLIQGTFVRWKAPSVTLHRKRADGTWAPVGTLTYTSTGVAKKSVTASGAATYRVVAAGTSTAWSATSATTRR